jgi:hypothetical protein
MAKRREASGYAAKPKAGKAKMPKPPKTGGRNVGRRGGR